MNNNTAYLSNVNNYTIFRFGDKRIKFVAPYSLERYTDIKEWDNGYLVVMAKYAKESEPIEEYIDLAPILSDLYMDADEFLQPIENVRLEYA